MLSKVLRRIPVVGEFVGLRSSVSALRLQIERLNRIQTIQIMDAAMRDHPHYQDTSRLLRYQSQVCSQNGEDGMIHEIFRRIETTNRVFAEIGVGNGVENNTAFLLSQGWSGFWIDGSDEFVGAIDRHPDIDDGCLKWLVSFVTEENIGTLFEQLGVPKEFDLMSLDFDQNTYFGWKGLQKFRPRVVVVEYNSSIPPDIDWKVKYRSDRVWDGTQNFGASLKSFELLGKELGYDLVGCDFVGANAFFVRSDLTADRFAAPFTAENHYEPPRFALSGRLAHRSAILDRSDC